MGPSVRNALSGLANAIAEVARRDPDRIAVGDGVATRSYGDLAELIATTPDARVGERGVHAVGDPVADVESIVAAAWSGRSLLLADEHATVTAVDRGGEVFAAAGPGGAVSIGLCTSGSSGLPKVVELDWEGLLLNARSFARTAGYREGDVVWCTTPLAHLYCFGAAVLGGLLSGATVLLTGSALESGEFGRLAVEHRPDFLLSVPFLFRHYLETLREDAQLAAAWSAPSSIAAGEPVPAELVESWREVAGSGLRAHYGLTEGGQTTLASGAAGEGVGRPLEDVEVVFGGGGGIRGG